MDETDPATVPTSPFEAPNVVEDRTAFSDALNHLIRAAEADGLDVEGGYRYVGEEGESSYGIEVYRVVDPAD